MLRESVVDDVGEGLHKAVIFCCIADVVQCDRFYDPRDGDRGLMTVGPLVGGRLSRNAGETKVGVFAMRDAANCRGAIAGWRH